MTSGGNSGLYQLVIRLEGGLIIKVGSRGTFAFPAGYYVYTGSAKRGLESRIARHLRNKKRMRWHIDYLLQYAKVIGVRRFRGNMSECALSRSVENLPNGRVVVRGFGSSDCACSAHLFHFLRNPTDELGRVQKSRRLGSSAR